MNLGTNVPLITTALIDAKGQMAQPWYQFIVTLFTRTGGTLGGSTDDLKQQIADLQAEVELLFAQASAGNADILAQVMQLRLLRAMRAQTPPPPPVPPLVSGTAPAPAPTPPPFNSPPPQLADLWQAMALKTGAPAVPAAPAPPPPQRPFDDGGIQTTLAILWAQFTAAIAGMLNLTGKTITGGAFDAESVVAPDIEATANLQADAFFTLPNAGTLTIATGAVTITASHHRVDTEGAVPADDLDTINGGSGGVVLIIQNTDDARMVTVKHGTGNIYLDGGADKVLDNVRDRLMLIGSGSTWLQLAYANNS